MLITQSHFKDSSGGKKFNYIVIILGNDYDDEPSRIYYNALYESVPDQWTLYLIDTVCGGYVRTKKITEGAYVLNCKKLPHIARLHTI